MPVRVLEGELRPRQGQLLQEEEDEVGQGRLVDTQEEGEVLREGALAPEGRER